MNLRMSYEEGDSIVTYPKDGYKAYVVLVVILLIFLITLLAVNVENNFGAAAVCGVCIIALLVRLSFAHYAYVKLLRREQECSRQTEISRGVRLSEHQSVYSIPITFDPPPNYDEVIKDIQHKKFVDVDHVDYETPSVHKSSCQTHKVSLESYIENGEPSSVIENEDLPPTYDDAVKIEVELGSYVPS